MSLPQLLGLWWALWLGASFVSNIAARAWLNTDSAEGLRNADKLELAACSFTVVAALLAIAVIRSLTDRQERRAQSVPRDA